MKATLYEEYSDQMETWACCKGFCGKKLKASSSLKNNAGIKYDPGQLADDDKNTAWIEGNEGDGIGEFIEFEYTYDKKYIDAADGACNYKDKFLILNGYQKSEIAWRENNRVKELKLFINDRLICTIQLLDKMGLQSMKIDFIKLLGKKSNTIKMRFEIAAVYKGSKYSDTAISGIFW